MSILIFSDIRRGADGSLLQFMDTKMSSEPMDAKLSLLESELATQDSAGGGYTILPDAEPLWRELLHGERHVYGIRNKYYQRDVDVYTFDLLPEEILHTQNLLVKFPEHIDTSSANSAVTEVDILIIQLCLYTKNGAIGNGLMDDMHLMRLVESYLRVLEGMLSEHRLVIVATRENENAHLSGRVHGQLLEMGVLWVSSLDEDVFETIENEIHCHDWAHERAIRSDMSSEMSSDSDSFDEYTSAV